MGRWLVIAVTIAYIVAALSMLLGRDKQPAQATMLLGYAIANLGLLWSMNQ